MANLYDLIQFTHIARTGGSSLRSSILENFKVIQTLQSPFLHQINLHLLAL